MPMLTLLNIVTVVVSTITSEKTTKPELWAFPNTISEVPLRLWKQYRDCMLDHSLDFEPQSLCETNDEHSSGISFNVYA